MRVVFIGSESEKNSVRMFLRNNYSLFGVGEDNYFFYFKTLSEFQKNVGIDADLIIIGKNFKSTSVVILTCALQQEPFPQYPYVIKIGTLKRFPRKFKKENLFREDAGYVNEYVQTIDEWNPEVFLQKRNFAH